MRDRPNLMRLLIVLGAVAAAAGIAGAAYGDPDNDPASLGAAPGPQASAQPVVTATPTAAPVAAQDCAPGSQGIYVGAHGNVDVSCALNVAGTRWQWSGITQRDNRLTGSKVGTTATDSTGAVWVARSTGSSNVWVWMAARNLGWHPPTRPYPAEGVTPNTTAN